jgi:transcriptional antiterminator RfaH
MPILPLEPDLFPADLLDRADSDWAIAQWWALYTLPRREKDLVRRLRRLGISHYAPLVKRRTRSPAGRKRISFVPLFPSYVFLAGSPEDRYQALASKCVARCLDVPDAPLLVRDLQQIRRLIEAEAPLTPESRLQPGMKVRIRSGSLAGLEGVVIKRRGVARLLVAVEFLQQGASVQLEDIDVEPLS